MTLPTRPNVHLSHSALIIGNDNEALSGRARGLHSMSMMENSVDLSTVYHFLLFALDKDTLTYFLGSIFVWSPYQSAPAVDTCQMVVT